MVVRASWTRIETWLAEHAADILDSLNPGATQEAISDAETTLGMGSLPTDFVQSWMIHDGQNWEHRPQLVAGSFGTYALMPLPHILEHWVTWTELLSSGTFEEVQAVPTGPVRADWWNERWVPIGVNAVGDMVCLDLDPPPNGTLGQVIEVLHDEENRVVLAKGVAAWLDDFATELEIEMYEAGHDQFSGLVHIRDT